MPKSRGRAQHKRKPPRTTQPTSIEGQGIKLAARLLDPECPRIDAELLASEVLAEMPTETRELRDKAIQKLIVQATRRRSAPAVALLKAVELVTSNPQITAALQEWDGEQLPELAWTTQPVPLPTGARSIRDEFDDHTIWLLDYDDCILAASTARWFHHGLLSASVLVPGPIGDLDKDASPVDLDTAVRALRDGLQHTAMLSPPHDDEDYLAHHALLSGRLRAIDVPELPEQEWEPISDADSTALLDQFFADSGTEQSESTRTLADLCLTYGDLQIDGDRLAWSPEIVEVFLDWVPRKTLLTDEEQRLLPVVSAAWIRWALTQRGLSPQLAEECVAVFGGQPS